MKNRIHTGIGRLRSMRKQTGYVVLTLVLLAAAVMVALTAAISVSKGNTTSNDTPRALGGGVMQEGISLANAFAEVRSQGVTAANITFTKTGGNDIIANGTSLGGLTVAPVLPGSAATSGASTGYWIYRSSGLNMKIGGTGTSNIASGGNTYTFIAPGITKDVCQAIVNGVWGSGNSNTTIPVASLTAAQVFGSSDPTPPTSSAPYDPTAAASSLTFSTSYPTGGSPLQGCFATTDTTYVAYVIVEAN